ncbi:MAG: hypothetical protein IPI29_14445 [Ignavibacteria bacterium]|nr:hypothetical protein [Ignavibacteria bacterium]
MSNITSGPTSGGGSDAIDRAFVAEFYQRSTQTFRLAKVMMYFTLTILSVITLTSALAPLLHCQWKATSGPYGGPVYALYWQDSLVLAGGTAGGVFISRDCGDLWSPVNTTGQRYDVNAIVAVGSVLLTSTGMRSTDLGSTWSEVVISKDHRVLDLYATDRFILAALDMGGILKSLDDGQTWVNSSKGLPSNEYIGTTVKSFARLGSALFALTEHGVFQASDDGGYWTLNAAERVSLGNETVFSYQAVDTSLIVAHTFSEVYSRSAGKESWKRILKARGLGGCIT